MIVKYKLRQHSHKLIWGKKCEIWKSSRPGIQKIGDNELVIALRREWLKYSHLTFMRVRAIRGTAIHKQACHIEQSASKQIMLL